MLRPVSNALVDTGPASNRSDPALRLIAAASGWQGDTPHPSLDFATQDYLGLATHPAIRAASQGPEPTGARQEFEARLASVLSLPAAATFSSGTEAIHRTLGSLLHPGDEVIVDTGAHPAMAESVLHAQAHLHRTPSGSAEGVERRLARLSRRPRHGRIFIAVPAVSAHGSRISDLAELVNLARQYDATLIVDVTHDLGAMGQTGGGVLEIQGCLGRADVVLGSLSQTFASKGGFAAVRNPDHLAALAQPHPKAPVPAATLLAALDLIASPEGRRRRRNLHGLSLRLRNHLMSDGIKVMGQASPFVPILLPPLTALPRTALLEGAGPRVTLLQAPTVPLHAPRWRIQLSATHSLADIDDLAELIRDVSRAFDRAPSRTRVLA
jgi:glycine C-acetyltransferase